VVSSLCDPVCYSSPTKARLAHHQRLAILRPRFTRRSDSSLPINLRPFHRRTRAFNFDHHLAIERRSCEAALSLPAPHSHGAGYYFALDSLFGLVLCFLRSFHSRQRCNQNISRIHTHSYQLDRLFRITRNVARLLFDVVEKFPIRSFFALSSLER
jgi:hypothetical protein